MNRADEHRAKPVQELLALDFGDALGDAVLERLGGTLGESEGDDLRRLPLSMRKANLARLLRGRPEGIFLSPFEQGEIGPDLFRKACEFGLEGLVSKHRDGPIGAADQSTG